jgi:hypothetical protein
MTCRLPFARKKSQAPRQAQRKIRKLTVQTSSKAIGKMGDDERRGYSPMTAFPEFAIPADVGQERVFPVSTPGAITRNSAVMLFGCSRFSEPMRKHLRGSDEGVYA